MTNPERYRSIFYNMSSMIDYSSSGGQDYTASYMYGPEQQQYSSQDYDTEANAAIIVDEAEKLFYKLIKDSINKVITDCTFSKSLSSLPLPLLSPSNEEQQSRVFQRPIGSNQTYVHKDHQ
jgi:hypothetical protein